MHCSMSEPVIKRDEQFRGIGKGLGFDDVRDPIKKAAKYANTAQWQKLRLLGYNATMNNPLVGLIQ